MSKVPIAPHDAFAGLIQDLHRRVSSLETAAAGPSLPVSASNGDDTEGTIASATYGDLTGTSPGPAVTLTTTNGVLVIITAEADSSIAGDTVMMSFDITGATSIGASDQWALQTSSGPPEMMSACLPMIVTPGLNTFTLKYKASASTGTFLHRSITVLSLP